MINLFVIQKQSIKLWQLKVSLNNILKQVKYLHKLSLVSLLIFSCPNLHMPYYTGSKTFGDIVSFAKANLNSNTSEPNLQD